MLHMCHKHRPFSRTFAAFADAMPHATRTPAFASISRVDRGRAQPQAAAVVTSSRVFVVPFDRIAAKPAPVAPLHRHDELASRGGAHATQGRGGVASTRTPSPAPDMVR